MLTTLSTVKSRLAILESDTQYDTLLTTAIKAVSARFDKETHRTLARPAHPHRVEPPPKTGLFSLDHLTSRRMI